ncbi:hypothetical protein E2C01_075689 [Portunus trituberculatus]|uniref:Uncharacterized protein n=1 Tax=Portunus trituberculatus TaxID=210409 RepID=A0A5B7IGZ4_PORTR|nr:hypothetical protein [Portunus trituberculatus]
MKAVSVGRPGRSGGRREGRLRHQPSRGRENPQSFSVRPDLPAIRGLGYGAAARTPSLVALRSPIQGNFVRNGETLASYDAGTGGGVEALLTVAVAVVTLEITGQGKIRTKHKHSPA